MMKNLLLVLMVGLFGFLTTLLIIPFIKKLALRTNIIAYPGGRRNHEKPTPLLGGVAIFLPFAVVFVLFYSIVMMGKLQVGHPEKLQMLSLFLGSTWILILGVIDDKAPLGWKKKLLGQVFGVVILVLGGHTISTVSIPLLGPVDFTWFGIPLFALAILVVTNAINLIDGLDGLAGGVCFFAAMTCGIIGFFKGDFFSVTVCFTISGSLLAFLWFNFPPASIYLGDGGSLTLGFLLGTLAASSSAIYPGQRTGTMGMILISFLPFSIALLDVILSVLRRWITGRKIFLPDADHLHHRLMEKFRNPRRVVAIFYFFSSILAAMTLFLVLGPQSVFFKVLSIVSGFFVVAVLGAVLKLYRIENLVKAIENRPHFQFVTSYRSFMSARICRADSFDALISLLESGVRDLGYDSVEVLSQGQTIGVWSNPGKVHPEAPRSYEEINIPEVGLTIKWVIPTHESESYQKFLAVTWYGFVKEIGCKAKSLAKQPPRSSGSENLCVSEVSYHLEHR
ncbi:MAG: MraY family glycosyltransferase [Desulfomonile sp.]